MNANEFRALSLEFETPDEIPLERLPENVAAVLSGADRFFDEPEDWPAAEIEIQKYHLLEESEKNECKFP